MARYSAWGRDGANHPARDLRGDLRRAAEGREPGDVLSRHEPDEDTALEERAA
jgi:hypothetical protein